MVRPVEKPLGEADVHAVRRVLRRIVHDEGITVDSKESMTEQGKTFLASIESLITARLIGSRSRTVKSKRTSRDKNNAAVG